MRGRGEASPDGIDGFSFLEWEVVESLGQEKDNATRDQVSGERPYGGGRTR
jgi:hypothetical protein